MPRRPPSHRPVKRWQGGATAEDWWRLIRVWATVEEQIRKDPDFVSLESEEGARRTKYIIRWRDGSRWRLTLDTRPTDFERIESLPVGRFVDDREERELTTATFWWYWHRFHGASYRRLGTGLVARAWYAGRHAEGVPVSPQPLADVGEREAQESWGQMTVARWVKRVEEILQVIHLDGPHRLS